MGSFYIGAVLCVLIASVFVFVPVIRFKKGKTVDENSLDWYKVSEKELKQDFVAGKLSEARYEEALVELKKRLADELELASAGSNKLVNRSSTAAKLVAMVLTLVSGIIMYAWLGALPEMERWETSLEKRSDLANRAFLQQQQTMSTTEMVDLALGIRTRLVDNPEDATGWMLLGRVLLVLRDQPGAETAYAKAYKLSPQKQEIIVGYSQALLTGTENSGWQKAFRLTKELLAIEPMNVTAMMLFSVSNIRIENTEVAKQSLNILLQMLSPEDPRYNWAQNELASISPQQANGSALLSVVVDVSDVVAAQLSEYQYLFVFARTDAMPMPVAAKKIAISDFPVTVTLSDSDAPMPTQKLSSFESVNLIARLSKDGNVAINSAQLEAVQNNVEVGQQTTVKMMISEN